MSTRVELVGHVAARLAAGCAVLVTGERGSGRTWLAKRASGEAALRGTGLRLVDRPGLALLTANRGEPLSADDLLVVEDVQWVDEQTLTTLRDHPGPLLLTGLVGATYEGAEVVVLPPLSDAEAEELADGPDTVRRAGGNPRLLTSLRAGTVPSGPAARTLRALWSDLDGAQRADALLLGVAGSLPLKSKGSSAFERVDGELRLRIGALGELAVLQATEDERRAACRKAASLLSDPRRTAPLLHAAGDLEAAREAALAGARTEPDPRRRADLLLLAGDLDDDLRDLEAESLWACWDLDGLLARAPADHRVRALALAARGDAGGDSPRSMVAQGRLYDGKDPSPDGRIASWASALARDELPVAPGALDLDEEQRWQVLALTAVGAVLDGRAPRGDVKLLQPGRWGQLGSLLSAVLDVLAEGASRDGAERLAQAVEGCSTTPVPAWGLLGLALCQADLGNAQEAAAALAAAAPTSALDRQLVGLVTAECELITGRPRVALRALSGLQLWPALAPQAAVAHAWAARTVGEPITDHVGDGGTVAARAAVLELAALRSGSAGDFLDAAQEWEQVSARRAVHCRWAAAVASEKVDVPALRMLEEHALAQGLMPLLARVRESLRRAGVRLERTVTGEVATAGLSAREVEVLGLVREGLTSAQAATRMGVAQSTVETQVASAMRKLGARNRKHAVVLLDGARV